MQVINIIDEDFVQYKKPSMFIGFPHCSFKCGNEVCQNYRLSKADLVSIRPEEIVNRYISNPITSAIVCGGLEPFDDKRDLLELVKCIREKTQDDIIIFTGYYPTEIEDSISALKEYSNIIIKFGRYIPDMLTTYSQLLGKTLASDNQFAVRIEDL